jgi:two-component system, NarL family, sensor histidine kinase UhpB
LMLEELGLKASLEELVSNWSIRYPDIHFVLNCPDEIDELEPKIAIQLFRVVQECMTNTVRHAIAKIMRIEAHFEKERADRVLNLKVQDDGVGCDPAKFRCCFGLRGIKARINSLGGTVEFSSAESRGMRIRVTIPVEE